jgi:soluble lytic murein transglycosylase-like protein
MSAPPTERRAGAPGRRRADGQVGPHGSVSNENGSRRGKSCGPFATCRRAVLVALQATVALSLFIGGAVWTARQQKPHFAKPGALFQLPSIPIVAEKPDSLPDPVRVYQVSRVLLKYTDDTVKAERIASALIKEGARKKLEPELLIGILLTEDVTLTPTSKSNVGATGLMQVMPFHEGKWKECGTGNLVDIEANICYGTSILADFVKRSPNLKSALQRYNGCVRGTNTPHCGTYSGKVLKYAEKAAQQMLGMALPEFLAGG